MVISVMDNSPRYASSETFTLWDKVWNLALSNARVQDGSLVVATQLHIIGLAGCVSSTPLMDTVSPTGN